MILLACEIKAEAAVLRGFYTKSSLGCLVWRFGDPSWPGGVQGCSVRKSIVISAWDLLKSAIQVTLGLLIKRVIIAWDLCDRDGFRAIMAIPKEAHAKSRRTEQHHPTVSQKPFALRRRGISDFSHLPNER